MTSHPLGQRHQGTVGNPLAALPFLVSEGAVAGSARMCPWYQSALWHTAWEMSGRHMQCRRLHGTASPLEGDNHMLPCNSTAVHSEGDTWPHTLLMMARSEIVQRRQAASTA
jgi:hypothetical protein